MPITSVMAEQTSFNPSSLIELWKLDGTSIGLDTIYYFVNSSSDSQNGTSPSFIYNPVTFNGVSYTPFPIKVEGFGTDGKGSNVRPKLTVSNIQGFVSSLLLQNQQLGGATVTRTRVFARYLDASNFPVPKPIWVTPDPTAAYPEEPFVVNRKIVENQQIVQFELAPPIDLQNVKLPRRQIIANVCTWQYRQSGTCDYSGVPVTDSAGRSFVSFYGLTLVNAGVYSAVTTYNAGDYVTIFSTLPQFSGTSIVYVCIKNGTVGINPVGNTSNWRQDYCLHNCAGCALRYPNLPLRGSFYPGVARAPWIDRA